MCCEQICCEQICRAQELGGRALALPASPPARLPARPPARLPASLPPAAQVRTVLPFTWAAAGTTV